MVNHKQQDGDQLETQEWLDALEDILSHDGPERAQYILNALHAKMGQAAPTGTLPSAIRSDFINTIPVERQPDYPGNLEHEQRLQELMLWNAAAMVVHANRIDGALGGHIATYASSSTLYEVLFQHFAHAESEAHGGDLVFVQGHASPGIYARALLEGRLTPEQIKNFRQEVGREGVSSYPHPHLMPTFWQFPTVSMGLGPIQAVYQARLLKYMHHRGLANTENRKVWAFCGDGEMAEPESVASLAFAVRQQLDNLIFVINCNLQSLDGPVTANTNIVREMEGMFAGAGWRVIKVLWSSAWDPLLEKDTSGKLIQRMNECLDGDWQTLTANDGAYWREHFFGKYPELVELVQDIPDEDLNQLIRGGHDFEKVYAAYAEATTANGQPTLILPMTVKGYGLGSAGESQNTAHNQKKMSFEQLQAYRDRLHIPLDDAQLEAPELYIPAPDEAAMQYLQSQREKLGGYLPARRTQSDVKLKAPALSDWTQLLEGSGDREISSNMAFVRVLSTLLRNKTLKEHIVPIVPDECRTLAMEGLFRQLGIYSPHGQQYTPVDEGQLVVFKESQTGQILNEGINEAGAFASWIAAGTSYSHNNVPLIPFYLFYSMFGFQRIGDLAWAAGDIQARGFLLGGLSGRTSLPGEGLQHADGHALLMAATIPSCEAYDPTYGYEIAVIIQDGLRRMLDDEENVFYYLTMMNEKYSHPAMPAGAEEGILKGMYLLESVTPEKINKKKKPARAQLLGSGAILLEVREAAQLLAKDFDVVSDVWSVTSYNRLRRDALAMAHDHMGSVTQDDDHKAYVSQCLDDTVGPIIAASDYMKLLPEQIRSFIPHKRFEVLGTDGYGRSASRDTLRDFFEVSARYIAFTAVKALIAEDMLPEKALEQAIELYQIDVDKIDPAKVHALD